MNKFEDFKSRISELTNSSDMIALTFEIFGKNISRKDLQKISRIQRARVEEIVTSPSYIPNF